MITVTEPFLPPLDEYVEYLKGIWDRNWLTNQGPLVLELEEKLQAYHCLGNPVTTVANGGLGLQILLKAFGVKGEVITTPFSYVATTSCPLWEGCTVKFADIDPVHLTLDPAAAEAAITPQTEAILATHVYGNPCDVEAFERIGQKYSIPILYDAAHAFGVTYKGCSLLEWGDASMVSLHATKLFHAVEGGFVTAKDPAVQEKLTWMRRFGHKRPEDFYGPGINAKMSEFHAAMGLANFPYLPEILKRRHEICEIYDSALKDQENIRPAFTLRKGTEGNACYYPILFQSETDLKKSEQALAKAQIGTRRYFHPLLSDIPSLQPLNFDLPHAIDIAKRVLCLPLATSMTEDDAQYVIKTLKATI